MSRSYLSFHSSPVNAVLRLLWMISALSSSFLFPSLWRLEFKKKRLCSVKKLAKMSYSNIPKTQLYTITEVLREEYLPIVIWNQRKRSRKAERFIALSPLNSFIISENRFFFHFPYPLTLRLEEQHFISSSHFKASVEVSMPVTLFRSLSMRELKQNDEQKN